MPLITERRAARKVLDSVVEHGAAMPIFCTASHWNTEAILLAAEKFCRKYEVESIPLSVTMTFNYPYMPQAQRVTRTGDAKFGFLSIMEHLALLCGTKDAPYGRVQVLPHLDHADPSRDLWALTEGTKYLASAMFDAQVYPRDENIAMTRDYVKHYGRELLVEGIMEELTVSAMHEGHGNTAEDAYPTLAAEYVRETGVDFLVADLGTEQQSAGSGNVRYLRERARALTAALGRPMLVLHGTSSLNRSQMENLAGDGVVRVNMWTKIAREAGKFAAFRLFEHAENICGNEFEAIESKQYLYDSIDKASEMMLEVLETLNYANFARSRS